MSRVLSISVPLLLLIAAGCAERSSTASSTPNGKYEIVTTTGMVADIVRQVAGEHANVTALLAAGVDPHLYRPQTSDVRRLMAADVVFYSGLMLEGRMADTLMQVGRRGTPVYAVTEGLEPSYLREIDDGAHFDPHVWMDVNAWSQCVELVAKALSDFDSAHAADYESNAAAYREKLAALDKYVHEAIASIPEPQRVLVTAHDAFGYFSQTYKIPVRSVQGISTESEAGIQDVNQLVDFIVERKLPAVFIESSVSPKNIRAVIEGAAQKGVTVEIGGELFSDAMGADGTYEGTYIGMIDHNATTIAKSLGGKVPEGGYRGLQESTAR